MVDKTTVLSGLSFAGVSIGLLWKWRFALVPITEFAITLLKAPFTQKRQAISQATTEPAPNWAIEIVIGDFKLTRQPSQQNIRRLSVADNVNQPFNENQSLEEQEMSAPQITQAAIQSLVTAWQGKPITAICVDSITQLLQNYRSLIDKYIPDQAVSVISEAVPFLVKEAFFAEQFIISESTKCFSCCTSDSTIPPRQKSTSSFVAQHPILCADACATTNITASSTVPLEPITSVSQTPIIGITTTATPANVTSIAVQQSLLHPIRSLCP